MYDKEYIGEQSSRELKELKPHSNKVNSKDVVNPNEQEICVIERYLRSDSYQGQYLPNRLPRVVVHSSLWHSNDSGYDCFRYRVLYKGLVKLDQIYDIGQFHDGLARICQDKNQLCGYLNTKGELVIPLLYTWCSDFKNGMAIVRKDKRLGVINTVGDILLPLEFVSIASAHMSNLNEYDIYQDALFDERGIPYQRIDGGKISIFR